MRRNVAVTQNVTLIATAAVSALREAMAGKSFKEGKIMRRRQSGIFLVSAAVAVGVVGVLVTFWGVQQSRQMRIERAERIGESLKAMGNAVETFTVKHHSDIDKLLAGTTDEFTVNGQRFTRIGTPGAGATTEMAGLTAQTLIRALALPGIGPTPPRGVGEYAISVKRICDAGASSSCRIDTLTYLTEPLKKTYSSEPDFNMAAVAARKIGVYGGMSRVEDAGRFRFIDQAEGALPVMNPLGIPGLLAMRGGSQTKDLNNTVSRDGSRGMTHDLPFNSTDASGKEVNHSILGVGDIKGAGTLHMSGLDVGAASIRGTLNLGSKIDDKPVHNNIVNAGDIEGTGRLTMAGLEVRSATVGALTATEGATINGKLDLKNNDIDGAKHVKAENVESRSLKSTSGVVELGKSVVEGTRCEVWGIGRDDAGRILSCQEDGLNNWQWKLAMKTVPVTKDKVPQPVVEQILNENRSNDLYISTFTIPAPKAGKAAVGFPLFLGSKGGVCKAEGGHFVMLYDYFETGRRNSWGYEQVGYQLESGVGTGRMRCLTKGPIAYQQLGGYQIAKNSTKRDRIGGQFFIGKRADRGDNSSGYSGELGSYLYLRQGHADFDQELRKFLVMPSGVLRGVYAGSTDMVQSDNGYWWSLY
jgi:hypothetical protein